MEQAGEEVTRFTEGDEIFAYCRKPMVQGGAYAEYIVLEEEHAAIKPKNTSFEEAASIPLAALTAYQSLFDAAKLQSGETVLIHAAAGGVGGFGVQLARDHGAVVWGTASARNKEYVQDLGGDRVVDYLQVDFREAVRSEYPDGVDVVFDCVGGEVLQKSTDIVKKGGRLISIVDDPTGLARRDIHKEFVFVAPNSTQLTELAGMVEQGRIKTSLSQVFPFGLEEARRAHELSESGRTRGKMVWFYKTRHFGEKDQRSFGQRSEDRRRKVIVKELSFYGFSPDSGFWLLYLMPCALPCARCENGRTALTST